jgi:hypothetical protein
VLEEWGIVHPQVWRVLKREGHEVKEVHGSDEAWVRTQRYVRRWLLVLVRSRHPEPPLVYASNKWYRRTLKHADALAAAWRLGGDAALLAAHDKLVGEGGWSKQT